MYCNQKHRSCKIGVQNEAPYNLALAHNMDFSLAKKENSRTTQYQNTVTVHYTATEFCHLCDEYLVFEKFGKF